MTYIHQCNEDASWMTCGLCFCPLCLLDDLLFALDFYWAATLKLFRSSLFHSLSIATFASGVCATCVMTAGVGSFACNVVFVKFSLEMVLLVILWIYEIPLYNRILFCGTLLDALSLFPIFPQIGRMLCPLLTKHGGVHGPFQLSPGIMDGLFVFFVLRTDQVDVSRWASVIEFWLRFRPFFFFFQAMTMTMTHSNEVCHMCQPCPTDSDGGVVTPTKNIIC